MSQNFLVSVNMDGPFIPSKHATPLDSLIAGILFRKYDDPEKAIKNVPLDDVEGVPCASVMLPEKLYKPELEKVIIRNCITREFSHNYKVPDMLSNLPRTVHTASRNSAGTLYSHQEFQQTMNTPTIYWFARGDMDHVYHIMKNLRFFGKGRTRGFGQIKENGVKVYPVETDNKLFSIVGNGSVLRPVPKTHLRILPEGTRYASSHLAWRLPYIKEYGAKIEECCIPEHFFGESFDIRRRAAMVN